MLEAEVVLMAAGESSPTPAEERRRQERAVVERELVPYRRHLREWRRFFRWVRRHRPALVAEVEFYGINFHRAIEAFAAAPASDRPYFLGQLDLLMRVMDSVKVRLFEEIVERRR